MSDRIIMTIQNKKVVGKRRDVMNGFDVSGMIKLLTNKAKLININMVPAISTLFNSIDQFLVETALQTNNGKIVGFGSDLTPIDLTYILNAATRYNIKLSSELIRIINAVLDPSLNGV
jgi:hypothetical protein